MTVTFKYDKDYCDTTVDLVYLSMLDPTINSGNVEGLDHAEVKDILVSSNREILKIYKDGVYVGYANPGDVHLDLYKRLDLDRTKSYKRLGVIFIYEQYRKQGIGEAVLRWFCDQNDNVLYLVDKTNESSNALANKVLNFDGPWWNGWRMKTFHVYSKTV